MIARSTGTCMQLVTRLTRRSSLCACVCWRPGPTLSFVRGIGASQFFGTEQSGAKFALAVFFFPLFLHY